MKLTIRSKHPGRLVSGRGVEVLMDGKRIGGLVSLDLSVAVDDVVSATLIVHPTDVEVDTEVLTYLRERAVVDESDSMSVTVCLDGRQVAEHVVRQINSDTFLTRRMG